MGTSYTYGATKASIIADITKNWGDGHTGIVHTCKEKKTVGNTVYSLWEKKSPEGISLLKYIRIDLLVSSRGYGWGYKGLDESMHPFYYDCPLKWFEEVPCPNESAANYRIKCAEQQAYKKDEKARLKNVLENIKPGDTLSLINSSIPQVTVIQSDPKIIGVYMNCRYRIPKTMIGEIIQTA
jgi:hypothetical protein